MKSTTEGLRPIRRIVTGENEKGNSVIISDGPTKNVTKTPFGLVAHVPWLTGESAATGSDPAPENLEIGFHSEGGTVFRIVDFPPDSAYNEEAMVDFLDNNGVRDTNKPRHFWFHKTMSLDYAIVLEGEIYAMLDEGETLMNQGDVLIQQSTNHSWSNRTDKPCRMAFVLIALPEDKLE